MRPVPATVLALAALAALSSRAWGAEDYPRLDDKGIGRDIQPAIVQIVEGDAAGGRAKLEPLARAGRTDAAEVLGEMLSNGSADLPDDWPQACRWFEIAARDRADGRHNLGVCYEHGNGGTVDLPLAARLYGEAGEMGFIKSKCALGTMLARGVGIPQDSRRAIALCTEGAEAGHADAQADMGDFYLMGAIVPRDFTKAAYWYEKAAAQSQVNASLNLGLMYWKGDGVKKDHARSAELWRVAHGGGRPDAAFLLAREAMNRAFADKGGTIDIPALEETIVWMEQARKSDPDPEHRKMMDEGLPLMRASLELARKSGSPLKRPAN